MITIQIITTILSWWAAYLFTEKSDFAAYIGVTAQLGWIVILSSWDAWPLLVCESGFFLIYLRACINQMRKRHGTN